MFFLSSPYFFSSSPLLWASKYWPLACLVFIDIIQTIQQHLHRRRKDYIFSISNQLDMLSTNILFRFLWIIVMLEGFIVVYFSKTSPRISSNNYREGVVKDYVLSISNQLNMLSTNISFFFYEYLYCLKDSLLFNFHKHHTDYPATLTMKVSTKMMF